MNNNGRTEQPHRSWAKPVNLVLDALEVDPESGLSGGEVTKRRNTYGENRLEQVEKESTLAILVRQFKSLIMAVLAGAAGLSIAFGEWIDAIGIVIALLINALIGFFTELKAVRSMESLQEMDVKYTTAYRDGKPKDIKAEEVVPGDIIAVEGGDVITADMRVIEANRLQVNESALTGESVPVQKSVEPVDEDTPLADRHSMLFKGTSVTEGSGRAVVVSTGMETELGAVATMVGEAESEQDPLKQRLDSLTTKLLRGIVVVAIIAAVAGVIAGKELFIMIETAVALFVAAVPEGLPVVATLALARGMRRMAKRNALVRRLSAVQTLGSTNTVFTDKTGTLTENQMTVTTYSDSGGRVRVSGEGLSSEGSFYREDREIDPHESDTIIRCLKIGILCNNASVEGDEAVGDPMEAALLIAGQKAGLTRRELLDEMPEIREISFDPDVKMMATFHERGQEVYEAVKGAPQAVLEHSTRIVRQDGSVDSLSDEERDKWLEENDELAKKGLRLLALAERNLESGDVEPYEELDFAGLVGLLDPPRADVKEAIAAAHRAGVRIVMVTGDQAQTAAAIGRELEIGGSEPAVRPGAELRPPEHLKEREREDLRKVDIFYRVSPEQKLNLIDLHQQANAIVAMTGDGVNDAPALKKADIGVAMGLRGEPVAEDAADVLLQDDRFATINVAIEHGRIIFENVRKFVLYMISGNIGEILVVLLATMAGAPLALLPLQILYINAVNDVFPALALGLGPGSGAVMDRPPRDPTEPIMPKKLWYLMGAYGALIGASVLGAFTLALTVFDMPVELAVTISFLSVAFSRLWHVFNMRDTDSSMLKNQVTRNPFVWGALALCVGLLLTAVYVGPVATALDVVPPGRLGWSLVLAASLVPLVIGQVGQKLAQVIRRRRGSLR